MEETTDEIQCLQASINGLISVFAIPAVWSGREPAQIASTLLDVLLRLLRLDFAYARLENPLGEAPIEVARVARERELTPLPQEIGQALNPWLEDHPKKWPLLVRNPMGEGDVSIVPLRLGLQNKIGIIVAGSQRVDFPAETERLLLRIAANQAAIALQQARDHNALDRLVAERTEKLARANELLHRSETYLADAQRLSHTGSWAFNVTTREIVHWSQEHFRIFGFDPEDGMPSFETLIQRIHPDDRAAAAEVIERGIRERTDYEQDFRIVLPNGTTRYMHAIGHPVFNSSGDPVEFVGTVIDVTERKRVGEERQTHLWFLESMDRVNRAIQGTNDLEQMMSDVLDTVLSIFNCDRSWLVYPCDPDAISWKVPMEHARPEFPGAFALGLDLPMDSEIATAFRTVRASNSPVRFGPESEHALPAETSRRFSIQSVLALAVYPKGDKPYMLGLHQCSYPRVWKSEEERLFQEIGRRLEDALTSLLLFRNLRESESYMRRSEAYLTEAQRLSHTGSWAWNISTGEVLWSREIYRIFGLAPEQTSLNVDLIKKLRHPDDRALAAQTLDGAVHERKDFEFESRIVLPDGSIRHVRSVGRPVINDAGVLVEFVGAVMDVTEGKMREEALRKSQGELAHVTRVATLGEMSASIAHEVNQPLAAVINSASACLRWLDAQKLEEARRSASRAIAEGHRASEIIGRIRALAKKAPPQKDWLDVNETIHEVIALALSEIQRNNIALEMQLSEQVPIILADRIEVQQVILNLVMNGIEAMDTVTDRPREMVIRSAAQESDKVLVAVQDSGIGIDSQTLDKIFDTFYTTKPQGMGMGLAISRSIVENHGGRLWATLNAPRGTVFQFVLPVGSG